VQDYGIKKWFLSKKLEKLSEWYQNWGSTGIFLISPGTIIKFPKSSRGARLFRGARVFGRWEYFIALVVNDNKTNNPGDSPTSTCIGKSIHILLPYICWKFRNQLSIGPKFLNTLYPNSAGNQMIFIYYFWIL